MYFFFYTLQLHLQCKVCFASGGCFCGYVRRFEIISPCKLFSFRAKCNFSSGSDVPDKITSLWCCLFICLFNKFPRHISHCKPRQQSLLYALICYAMSMLSSCSIKPQKNNTIWSENTICCFSTPLSFLIVHFCKVTCSPHMSFCEFGLWCHSSK